jgi:hypothetical protein
MGTAHHGSGAVKTVRTNVTIDWILRETSAPRLRVLVKRILRKYGYPPDKQAKTTQRCRSSLRFSRKRGNGLTDGRGARTYTRGAV